MKSYAVNRNKVEHNMKKVDKGIIEKWGIRVETGSWSNQCEAQLVMECRVWTELRFGVSGLLRLLGFPRLALMC